jgi:hypothetical protein
MDGVLPLVTAELLHLELFRHRALVLGRRVIPTFALGALHCDDFSSLARHFSKTPVDFL